MHDGHVRTGREHEAHARGRAVADCIDERRGIFVVLQVDVGTVLEQQFRDIDMLIVAGTLERGRHIILAHAVHVGVVLDQHRGALHIAVRDRSVERRLTVRKRVLLLAVKAADEHGVRRVHARAVLEEDLDAAWVAHLARKQEWSIQILFLIVNAAACLTFDGGLQVAPVVGADAELEKRRRLHR